MYLYEQMSSSFSFYNVAFTFQFDGMIRVVHHYVTVSCLSWKIKLWRSRFYKGKKADVSY